MAVRSAYGPAILRRHRSCRARSRRQLDAKRGAPSARSAWLHRIRRSRSAGRLLVERDNGPIHGRCHLNVRGRDYRQRRRHGTDQRPVATSAATTTAGAASSTTTAPPATGAALEVSQITFPGPVGELKGAFSAAPKPKGAVLIVHEIFGLSAHFLKLPGRFAASGYTAVVVDLLSREGGTAAIADQGQITAKIVGGGVERHLADLRAGLDELGKRAPGVKLGMVGFCFGGGMTWSMLNAGEPRLAVAAPFYRPGADGADFSKSKAAVLGVYAENDARVNASRDAMEAALTKAGLVHEIKTFPGVGHQFFNDTGGAYNPAQAEAAYPELMSWFARTSTDSVGPDGVGAPKVSTGWSRVFNGRDHLSNATSTGVPERSAPQGLRTDERPLPRRHRRRRSVSLLV